MPGPAAGDHRYAGLGEEPRRFLGGLVHRVARLGARRTEERHAAGHVLQVVEAPDELALDAEHAPRIRRAPKAADVLVDRHVEQLFVFGRVRLAPGLGG